MTCPRLVRYRFEHSTFRLPPGRLTGLGRDFAMNGNLPKVKQRAKLKERLEEKTLFSVLVLGVKERNNKCKLNFINLSFTAMAGEISDK